MKIFNVVFNLEKSVRSRFLAQSIDSTALQKNTHLTEWARLIFFKSTVKSMSCTINLRPTDLSRFKRALLTMLIIILPIACNVAPWERGNLAKREMLINPNLSYSSLRTHVFDSKEASSGGSGAAGGGCGCN